jgi:hypothetical protein
MLQPHMAPIHPFDRDDGHLPGGYAAFHGLERHLHGGYAAFHGLERHLHGGYAAFHGLERHLPVGTRHSTVSKGTYRSVRGIPRSRKARTGSVRGIPRSRKALTGGYAAFHGLERHLPGGYAAFGGPFHARVRSAARTHACGLALAGAAVGVDKVLGRASLVPGGPEALDPNVIPMRTGTTFPASRLGATRSCVRVRGCSNGTRSCRTGSCGSCRGRRRSAGSCRGRRC